MYGVPSQQVGCPAKVYGQQHYFQILSTFSYDFLLAVGWPTLYGSGLKQVILWIDTYILICHDIDLKQIAIHFRL